jgi:hypothetical protein
MRFKSYRIKRVLSGYILITTSGVMFFIITAVTILHLMSAKTLTKEYRLHDAYQDMLNQQGIRQILAMQISNNESTLSLPDSLDSMYGVTHAQLANGSVDFFVENNDTGRVTSFNIRMPLMEESKSAVDLSTLSIANNVISGIRINSSESTNLVSLQSVWFPSYGGEFVSYYEINEAIYTANVLESEEYYLPQDVSGSEKNISVYFSSVLADRALSIYLKYSDGSIKDINIEI